MATTVLLERDSDVMEVVTQVVSYEEILNETAHPIKIDRIFSKHSDMNIKKVVLLGDSNPTTEVFGGILYSGASLAEDNKVHGANHKVDGIKEKVHFCSLPRTSRSDPCVLWEAADAATVSKWTNIQEDISGMNLKKTGMIRKLQEHLGKEHLEKHGHEYCLGEYYKMYSTGLNDLYFKIFGSTKTRLEPTKGKEKSEKTYCVTIGIVLTPKEMAPAIAPAPSKFEGEERDSEDEMTDSDEE